MFSTLMVHLDLEHSNDARLEVAGELARQFDARLIGIAACEYSQGPYFAEGDFARQLLEQDRAKLDKRMAEMESSFRGVAERHARDIEWRSTLDLPTNYVAEQARAADLVITGSQRDGMILDPLRRLDPGDLVMRAGRPVLVVPPETERPKFTKVLVAWKDTREARRAVRDALPLLRKGKEVGVVEIVQDEGDRSAARARVDDVVAWLARHDIRGSAIVPDAADDAASQLELVAQEHGAQLIVAGAYGHSRLSEWVFGGVTRDLLMRSQRCSLLAH